MNLRVIGSAALIAALTATFATGQSTNESVRISVPTRGDVQFQIIDPIQQRAKANAGAQRSSRPFISTPNVEWNGPIAPAARRRPALPPHQIAAPSVRRGSVRQASGQQRQLSSQQIRLVQAEEVDDNFLDDLKDMVEDLSLIHI